MDTNRDKMSLDSITDDELRTRLAEYGYPVGPVVATTRNVLLNKLKSLITGSQSAPSVRHSVASQLDENLQLLFFDIETSGLEMDCDVLQIAVKIGSSVFNEYIKPTKKIPWNVSLINNLYNRNGELYFMDVICRTQPLPIVLESLLKYLKTFKKPCVLVAHNCSFDASRLIRIIKQESMEHEFGCVIAGFTDTLAMFREKFPGRRARGSCTLTTLVAETLSVSTAGAHDAYHDVILLETLALHHFTIQELLAKRLEFVAVLEEQMKKR